MMATAIAPSSVGRETHLTVPLFQGGAAELMSAADTEVCMDGPAGTGKSFAALWKMHLRRIYFPGSRGLLARKTLISLKSSTLVTYKQQVLGPLYTSGLVKFYGARGDEPAHYAYWNGSKEVIVGLDNPGKSMSTEYDDVLIDEVLDCEEGDIEALLTRIQRPGHLYGVGMPDRPPFAQLTLVTNPGPFTHWLNQRMLAKRTRRIVSFHHDNPAMTSEYLELLDRSLTGARRKRLFLGIWASAEGTVYEDAWAPERNLMSRGEISARPDDLTGDCGIDPTWPRYISIDWGTVNPAVVQWYAIDHDGRPWLYRELYQTRTAVEDLARRALELMGWKWSVAEQSYWPTHTHPDPLPREVICDHAKQERMTWERYFGLGTYPADKGPNSVTDGIAAVTTRLRDARLFVLRDSTVARDTELLNAKRPSATQDEYDSYIWDIRAGRTPRDVPADRDNHGMDAQRYLVQYLDRDPLSSSQSIPFEAIGF